MMKRYVKNIINIVLIFVMCGLLFLTISHAKTSMVTSNSNMMEMPGNQEKSEMKDQNSNDDGEFVDDKNMGEPPEKPDGEESDGGMMEKPDGMDDNSTNTPPSMNGNGNMPGNPPTMNNNSNLKMDSIYYVVFAIIGLVISCLVIYLIMSNFNKKSFKETFRNKDKIMISILSIIILTSAITYFSGKVTSNSNNDNTTNNINQENNNISYQAEKEITENTTIEDGKFSSSNEDSNAILVNGDIDVNLSNIIVTKTGDSDGGDNTSFYGTNSAILAKSGAILNLKNITVETNATGANGVFSYGGSATTNNTSSDSTTINISDSKITTTKDNSGGIMTTGGGIMNATNLEVETSGTSSAAIRTDRGGGTVTVSKGTYKTTGQGSPTIYSTANITVNDATLIAGASDGVVIEGKNSVSLDNCDLIDTNNKLNGKSTTYKNIFLYQSMSGDASSGTSVFTSKNSRITTNKGDTFYITNTTATINLTNNTIINNDSSGNFLRSQADSWGNSGSNGGVVTLNMTNQNALGNIVIDSISTLTMNLKESSYYEGTINGDNSAKEIDLVIDNTSKIKLTGDSYVTKLTNSDSSNSNIDFNGYKLYVNGVAIN